MNTASVHEYIKRMRITGRDWENCTENSDKRGEQQVKLAYSWLLSQAQRCDTIKETGGTYTEKIRAFITNIDALTVSDFEDPDAVRNAAGDDGAMLFEALVNYSLYSLHSLAEQEEKAADKKTEAEMLLSGIVPCAGVKYSDLIKPGGKDEATGTVAGAVRGFTDEEIKKIAGYNL